MAEIINPIVMLISYAKMCPIMQHTIFYYNYHLYIYNYNICIKLTLQLGSSKLGFDSELEKEGCVSIALLKLVGLAC